jgi:protein-S-isoprenylcysteine O-methyltransferase Ste14
MVGLFLPFLWGTIIARQRDISLMETGLRKKARMLADGQGYFLVLLLLAIASHFVFPVRVVLHPPVTWFGLLIIAAGLLLAFRCRALFLKNRTTMSPYESPVVLVTTGPFRFSRNPAYLAMSVILFGSAVVTGTLAPFVFPVVFIVIIGVLFIPDEERRLEDVFGREYREYRQRVRRWV